MRSHVVMLGLAFALVPAVAHADNAECFDASEKAQKLKSEKKFTQARSAFITCAREVCPQAVRVECAKWLSEVESGLATVVVRARDSGGHDVIDVKVYVDGELFLPKLAGAATAVDPGQHKFKYEFPNGKVVEDDVLIAEGEKDRVLRVEIKDGEGGGGSGGGGGGSGGAGSGGGSGGGGESHGPGPLPWIIGGVGIASLIGFAIIEAPIQSQASSLQDGCGKTKSCSQSQVDSVTSLYAPAGIMLGVGIVGVAVGLVWLIVSATTGHKTASTGSFSFTPLVGGGAYGGYVHSF